MLAAAAGSRTGEGRGGGPRVAVGRACDAARGSVAHGKGGGWTDPFIGHWLHEGSCSVILGGQKQDDSQLSAALNFWGSEA